MAHCSVPGCDVTAEDHQKGDMARCSVPGCDVTADDHHKGYALYQPSCGIQVVSYLYHWGHVLDMDVTRTVQQEDFQNKHVCSKHFESHNFDFKNTTAEQDSLLITSTGSDIIRDSKMLKVDGIPGIMGWRNEDKTYHKWVQVDQNVQSTDTNRQRMRLEHSTVADIGLCLHELIEEQLSYNKHVLSMSAVCFVQEGHTYEVTYNQLMDYANKVAAWLRYFQCFGEVVGVCCCDQPLLPSWLMGVMSVPASFLPLDPDLPVSRLTYLISRLGVRVIMVDTHGLEKLQQKISDLIKLVHPLHIPIADMKQILGSSKQLIYCILIHTTTADIATDHGRSHAYVITTSGTTGLPKTVTVPHSCITPNITHLSEIYRLTPRDVVFQASPLTFDPSIVEIFTTLYKGATLLILPEVMKKTPEMLAKILCEQNVTVLQATPALMYSIGTETLATTLLSGTTSLRTLALGGERCPSPSTLQSWRCHGNQTTVINLYGITEVSSWATYHVVTDADGDEIPLGKPLDGTVLHISNTRGHPCGTGNHGDVEGQLLIGGTERQCLLDDAWPPRALSQNLVMRETGDLVRKDDQDRLWYMARMDEQVKRNGKRINLIELEKLAEKFDCGLRAVAVMDDKNKLYLFLQRFSENSSLGEHNEHVGKKSVSPDTSNEVNVLTQSANNWRSGYQQDYYHVYSLDGSVMTLTADNDPQLPWLWNDDPPLPWLLNDSRPKSGLEFKSKMPGSIGFKPNSGVEIPIDRTFKTDLKSHPSRGEEHFHSLDGSLSQAQAADILNQPKTDIHKVINKINTKYFTYGDDTNNISRAVMDKNEQDSTEMGSNNDINYYSRTLDLIQNTSKRQNIPVHDLPKSLLGASQQDTGKRNVSIDKQHELLQSCTRSNDDIDHVDAGRDVKRSKISLNKIKLMPNDTVVYAVRDILRESLPDYYHPDVIVIVPQMPITKHGKVDKKQLFDGYQKARSRARPATSAVGTVYIKHDLRLHAEHLWKICCYLDSSHMVSDKGLFLESGGNSLSAVTLTELMEDKILGHPWQNLLDLVLTKPFGTLVHELVKHCSDGSASNTEINKGQTTRLDTLDTKHMGSSIVHHSTDHGLDDHHIITDSDVDSVFRKSLKKQKLQTSPANEALSSHPGPTEVDSPPVAKKPSVDSESLVKTTGDDLRNTDNQHDPQYWLTGQTMLCNHGNQAVTSINRMSVCLAHCQTCVMRRILPRNIALTDRLPIPQTDRLSVLFDPLWSCYVNKCVDSSPVCIHDHSTDQRMIIVGSHSYKRTLVAIDLDSGQLIWSHGLDTRIESSPCLSKCGRFVIAGAYNHQVYIVAVDSGEIVFTHTTQDQIKSSPCVNPVRGLVYVGSHDGTLYCIDVQARKCVWESKLGHGCISASPCISTEPYLLYVATLTGTIHCLHPDTGEELWMENLGDAIFSSPALTPEGVCVVSVKGCVRHYSHSKHVIWKYEIKHFVFSSLCVYGVTEHTLFDEDIPPQHQNATSSEQEKQPNVSVSETKLESSSEIKHGSFTVDELDMTSRHINCSANNQSNVMNKNNNQKPCDWFTIIGDQSGYVHCLDYQGNLCWCHRMPSKVYSSPFIFQCPTKDHALLVAVCCSQGELHVLSLHTGAVVGKVQLGKAEIYSSPVIYRDTIIIGSRGNHVLCVKMNFTKDNIKMDILGDDPQYCFQT